MIKCKCLYLDGKQCDKEATELLPIKVIPYTERAKSDPWYLAEHGGLMTMLYVHPDCAPRVLAEHGQWARPLRPLSLSAQMYSEGRVNGD